MPLNPSRRDTIGPPPRDVSDLAARVRHQGSYLRSLDPGIQEGRFATPRPFPPGLGSQLVGEDSTGDERIHFHNQDQAVSTGPNNSIPIRLTYTPEEGSEQVYYNGTPLKRGDWTRTDTVLTIPGEPWFRRGKVAWVDYAYYDEEADVDAPVFVSVSSVSTDHTSIPSPADPLAGDLLVLVLSATNQVGCTDPRFSVKNFGTRPTWTGPLMSVWAGIDDGSGNPISVLMDSVSGSGGADSCGAVMRIRGNPLLPATSEAALAGSVATFVPAMPALGSFGIMAIASEVGLVSSTISDDQLSNWTTRLRMSGAGGGHTSIYLGTAPGLPTGRWTQAGSDPLFVAWAAGLQ